MSQKHAQIDNGGHTAIAEDRGAALQRFDQEAMRCLMNFGWPGNVRQLENVVEHAFVVGQGPVLKPEHFPSYILRASALTPAGEPARRSPDSEREELLAVLRKHGRNKTLAALELGIHRSTLWRRMRKFGLTEEPLETEAKEAPSGQQDKKKDGP